MKAASEPGTAALTTSQSAQVSDERMFFAAHLNLLGEITQTLAAKHQTFKQCRFLTCISAAILQEKRKELAVH